jgi:hypothetical protein
VDRVEVVVDGDPTDTHCVGHIFNSTPQNERATFVEEPDRPLLAFARQHRQRVAQFGLDGIDQPVERPVQRRQPHCGDGHAFPNQRNITRLGVVDIDERRSDRIDERFGREYQWMNTCERVALGRHRMETIRLDPRRPTGRSDRSADAHHPTQFISSRRAVFARHAEGIIQLAERRFE